jgi:hypothetical protein
MSGGKKSGEFRKKNIEEKTKMKAKKEAYHGGRNRHSDVFGLRNHLQSGKFYFTDA